jgi:hypothetical protein
MMDGIARTVRTTITSIAQYASSGAPTEEDQFALPESRHQSKTDTKE